MKSDHAAYLRALAAKSWEAAQSVEGWRIQAVETLLASFPDQEAVEARENLRDAKVLSGVGKLVLKRQEADDREGQHDDDPTQPGAPASLVTKGTKH